MAWMSGVTGSHEGDLELLNAVIAGAPGAWPRFYQRYERLIVACIRKVLARYGVAFQPSDLEDLLNTVCLNLVRDDFEKLRRYDPTRGYQVSSWIGLIATNSTHDALRRRGPAHYSLDDDDEWTEMPDEQPSPAELAVWRERESWLNRAVGRLSPAEQQFLRYYYHENREPEEIATLMGISVNTVYSRKNKVRAALKRIIDEMMA
jgi:RNA polymerase sigma-70 factor (ECF subfamily)